MKFFAENVHDLRHTFSAVDGQTVKIRAANQYGLRSERQCLEDVRAAPDATVHQHRDAARHALHDGFERVDGSGKRVCRSF